MQNALKMKQQLGCTQFDLTKKTLNNLSQYEITPTAKLVLLYLTTCYNPNHADVFPKQKTIADKIGVSERSVIRAIQELVKAGLILIECKHTNRYKLIQNTTSQLSQTDKLSKTECQNVTFTPDNLSSTCYEQIKETNKEQTVKSGENVYKGDDAILYEYAKTRAKYSVNAFIDKIKENGGADKIIKEYKSKVHNPHIAFKKTALLGEIRKQSQEQAVPPTEAWKALRNTIFKDYQKM